MQSLWATLVQEGQKKEEGETGEKKNPGRRRLLVEPWQVQVSHQKRKRVLVGIKFAGYQPMSDRDKWTSGISGRKFPRKFPRFSRAELDSL